MNTLSKATLVVSSDRYQMLDFNGDLYSMDAKEHEVFADAYASKISMTIIHEHDPNAQIEASVIKITKAGRSRYQLIRTED